ncbi:MAG TPA: type II toxin-antitoxin system VapC family toxin [Gemmatirosa sp.]
MRALDTNVLVRYIVHDDDAQHAAAAAQIDGAVERSETFFVSDPVLCELVWVLRATYRQDRAALVPVLRSLVAAQHLTFPERDGVVRAVDAFARGQGDFADYLIRERALAAGCDAVVTFDRALHREPGFVPPA